jgi:hypothetical protein
MGMQGRMLLQLLLQMLLVVLLGRLTLLGLIGRNYSANFKNSISASVGTTCVAGNDAG